MTAAKQRECFQQSRRELLFKLDTATTPLTGIPMAATQTTPPRLSGTRQPEKGSPLAKTGISPPTKRFPSRTRYISVCMYILAREGGLHSDRVVMTAFELQP